MVLAVFLAASVKSMLLCLACDSDESRARKGAIILLLQKNNQQNEPAMPVPIFVFKNRSKFGNTNA